MCGSENNREEQLLGSQQRPPSEPPNTSGTDEEIRQPGCPCPDPQPVGKGKGPQSRLADSRVPPKSSYWQVFYTQDLGFHLHQTQQGGYCE